MPTSRCSLFACLRVCSSFTRVTKTFCFLSRQSLNFIIVISFRCRFYLQNFCYETPKNFKNKIIYSHFLYILDILLQFLVSSAKLFRGMTVTFQRFSDERLNHALFRKLYALITKSSLPRCLLKFICYTQS